MPKTCDTKDKNCACKGCPLFKLITNPKNWLTIAIASVWVVLFDWLWHENIMADAYAQTAHLWRSVADINMGVMLTGQILFAVLAFFIFTEGAKHLGKWEGIRFGFYLTLFVSSMYLIFYAVMPIPQAMLCMWILGAFICLTVLGLIFSMRTCCGHCKK